MTSKLQDKNLKGSLLKETREAKGIALETVHDATKIPMDALRAIEEGYSLKILSSFYYKGFLKIYAQYLGVDIQNVIDDYKAEKLPEPIKTTHLESKVLQDNFDKVFTRERKQIFVLVVAGLIGIFVLFQIGSFVFKKRDSAKEESPVKKEIQEKHEKKRQAAKKRKTAASPVASDTEAVSTVQVNVPPTPPPVAINQDNSSKGISLAVRAKRSGWLQVKVDGTVVFQSVLKKGAVETWAAEKDVEISGNNISDLDLELNGKMIALGKEDRKAKRVIITKDGLSVKK